MAGREDFEIAVVDNRLPDERGFQVIRRPEAGRLYRGAIKG